VRVPLSVRIFLVQLVFVAGAAAVAAYMVNSAFRRYARSWEQEVATLPTERLLQPVASEVAHSLLLALDKLPEVRERDQEAIARGLRAILKGVPAVRYLIVVDGERRIQFASEPSSLDLAYRDPDYVSLFASEVPTRRRRLLGDEAITELMLPIYEEGKGREGVGRRRLGSVLVGLSPDPVLLARVPPLRPPRIPPGDYLWPLTVLLGAVGVAGLLVSALTGLPVRRLDRALRDYRARGFEGRFELEGVPPGAGLASTVSAISELGVRLAALDALAREREALLATLTQALEDGIVAFDPEGRPLAWNRAALRMLGVESGGPEPPADRTEQERLKEAIARQPALVAEGSDGSSPAERDIELPGTGGQPLLVHLLEVPFEVRPGRKGRLLFLRDLSMLRKVETHLLEAGRYAVLAHLAGSLAHEIRNPLHSIGVNASVLEQYVASMAKDEPSFRAVSESLSAIQEETRRLTDLLNNYLGMVRSSPAPGPVDVRELCRKVLQLLAYPASLSKVELRLEGEEDVPPVRGVPDRLQQAILNLVLNAIQAMPQGGLVRVRTGRVDGRVHVAVTDTGPGLPPELAERPFDTRISTKSAGAGLGLPIVRMIVESHGGSVWYRSKPGEGTTFTLVLPAEPRA
jgi:signal transduction histidine kinase